MAVYTDQPTGWKTVAKVWLNVSGTWKQVIGIWNNVAGTWKQSFGVPLVASVTPTSAFGSTMGTLAVSNSVTASATGGIGSYSMQWLLVSGDSATVPTNPTLPTTQFKRGGAPNASYSSTWTCRVTDQAGNVVDSPNVSVTLQFGTPP